MLQKSLQTALFISHKYYTKKMFHYPIFLRNNIIVKKQIIYVLLFIEYVIFAALIIKVK